MVKLTLVPLGLLLSLVIGSLCALIFQLDFPVLLSVLKDPELHFALFLSLATAFVSLLLSLIIGIPAAWAMARIQFSGKYIANILLDLPLVTPPLVVGIGLLLLLGHQGPLSGILPQLTSMLFSPIGVVIAQTYVASAIIFRTANAAFLAIDPAYISTGQNLGLTPLQTLCLVEIPLCWQALLSGAILALARALGEFGATLMLAGAVRLKTETLPIAIYLNIASGDFSLAIGCALLLMLLACVLLIALRLFTRRDKEDGYAAN
ncbi:ABC transporter permease [Yersinia alsatica]|uniref:ABC transporter permease n=1 Tax=Yersinia alsatica TaxID=2890317 RepID=UPI0011AAB55E|nr:ABC transporter permease [Yersinia alsatica]